MEKDRIKDMGGKILKAAGGVVVLAGIALKLDRNGTELNKPPHRRNSFNEPGTSSQEDPKED
jgi:hypothetical protein